MKEKILEICIRNCGKNIMENEELIHSGILASYQLLEIICALEEEFGIEFTQEEIGNLDNFVTVTNMEVIIISKLNDKEGR